MENTENLNATYYYQKTTELLPAFLSELGQEVLRARSAKKLTQAQISELTGGLIKPDQLERIEIGVSQVRYQTLLTLSLILGKKLKITFE